MSTNLRSDPVTAITIAVIQQFNEALNRRDIEAMMALLTDDCVFENTYPAPDGTRYAGQAAVCAFWEEFFRSSPYAEIEIEEIFAVGERGVMRWVYGWTNMEGRSGHIRGVDVYRVRNGRIAENLSYVKG